ncbi:MAG: DUF5721 family protein [Defluviitaleaceae bacterium]|nr:DUF5721 family protein [Defluviitaleaceae bacterium]MCL2239308.1 DUF5721 family protein [Defluviitaleaceae bacterium]
MQAFTLDPAAVKDFMGRLLREDFLDFFAVRNVELTLATRISISGQLETEDEPRPAAHATWGDLRPLVYALIKRGIKPKLLKIVLSHPAPTQIHENAAALFLNLTYEKDGVAFTTATAQREFALDKSLDKAWDPWVRDFFEKSGVQVGSALPEGAENHG